jgi:hypothetical protein
VSQSKSEATYGELGGEQARDVVAEQAEVAELRLEIAGTLAVPRQGPRDGVLEDLLQHLLGLEVLGST